MKKLSIKKLVSALALSMSLALTIPSVLPVVSTMATVEAATTATLSQQSATLRAGEVIKLKVANKGKKSVKWTTNKSKIATVKNGLITAVGKGSAVITAKVGNKKLKCNITVTNNSYSFDVPAATAIDSGTIAYIPANVYYKNAKLYCKTEFINRQFSSKIKKFVDKNGNNISKLDVVLTAYTLTSPTTYTKTVIAKGKIKNTLPKNILYNNSKMFTVEFSGSQIKQKGYDLSKVDFVELQIKTKLFCTY
jgi:hypothetical protein